MIHFNPVDHHIEDRAHTRLCDGRPASDTDVSSEDWSALREARRDTTLCPDCQDRVNPRDVRSELYGMGRHTTAHLYAVPALAAFDEIRNCSHCMWDTDDNCKVWRQVRKSEAVLTHEARRLANGVDELWDATGGRTANIYQFACGTGSETRLYELRNQTCAVWFRMRRSGFVLTAQCHAGSGDRRRLLEICIHHNWGTGHVPQADIASVLLQASCA